MKLYEMMEEYGDYTVKDGFLDFLERPKLKTAWDLKPGDKYFYINQRYDICEMTWEDCNPHTNNRLMNNCFLKEEHVERELDRRLIHSQLKELAKGYEFTPNKENWSLIYNTDIGLVTCVCSAYRQNANVVYFPTYELVREALETFGQAQLAKEYFQVIE